MSATCAAAYSFVTAAQWDACLFASADRESRAARTGLRPQAPYQGTARTLASVGAFAPMLTRAGELLWRDAGGRLLRALPSDAAAEQRTAPLAIAQAMRMVVTQDAIWVAGSAPGTLESFELDTLTRRQVLDIPDARVIDLAADESTGLLVLIERQQRCEILQVRCGGTPTTLARIDAGLAPTLMANLPAQRRIFLLDEGGTRLVALERGEGTPAWTRQLGAFSPCFVASALSSDGRGRVFLVGVDGADFGSAPHALALDSEAELIDSLPLAQPGTGIAGGHGVLAVSHVGGVDVHDRATVAGDSTAVAAELVTPLLSAPDSDAEIKWQRVDAWATLPEGTTLELRYGWTEDPELAERALRITRDARIPPSQRLAWLSASLDHWSTPVSFAGSARRAVFDSQAPPMAFPLQDARAGAFWVHVTLRATPRSALPALTRMSVSYAGSAMLQQLPAIYRRTAAQPGDFLGALVGTLEATSQELDRRIGALGGLVHPDTAPPEWLDELAEWLGLPWDDALTPTQKRAIVSHAGELAAERGTRGGLALLLQSLFPGQPPRFRISDLDVDFGFVTLGGGARRGSALPALLAGLPRSATVLSRKAILGTARLPCAGAMPSSTRDLAGRLRIDLYVDGAAQRASRPWLTRLLDSTLPGNLRVELRWHAQPLDADPEGQLLVEAPQPRLGRDAITGHARLPAGRSPTLWS
ncbi:phage tail protein [Variovorax sp. J31P179]|uniref:phage tail protein n=1 Tax=Variovorax sp. J31P179 TaxID=3053508 RepID=UPI002576F6D4|nr:phage tail protein [Variovorax sp. J31P179]MDM0085095.1 phage tail protein [Variovorax sp. J31P179]